MKNLKKIKLTTVIGCLAAATLVYFNVRHALNDYGVRDNEHLHEQVLAQGTTTTTGNGSNSGGWFSGIVSWYNSKVYRCEEDSCSLTIVFWTWYGKYEKCKDGSTVAHCTDCAGCDAF